ncbi:MAG: T9SS type A sorting domain-containing protein [Bacteroidetes bacterium]|nr:T9SS type A sorting domain-containing protein [Bacteroidota bacterium]
MSGGTLEITHIGGSNRTVYVGGNFSMTGGTLILSESSLIGTLNIPGDFSHISGTLTETSTGSGALVFSKSGIQIYTSGGTISNTINFTVNSGSTLQMASASTTITGGGSFTLSSGASLGITSSNGITTSGASGNIQVTGTRNYNTGTNYTYNGTESQNMGNGFPNNLSGTLTIDNSGNSVTLETTRTIANGGSIVLAAGTFAAGSNLTMASTSSITRSGGDMTGNPQGSGTYNVTYSGNSKTTGTELAGSGLNNITVNLNSDQTLTLDQSRTVAGTLTLTSGNAATGSNTLTLGTSTSSLGSLARTSGTIIGNFQCWFAASTVSNVLFPIGTASNYRPANISFTVAPSTGGTLTAFFTASDPGTVGLPLDDGGTSIVNAGNEGYWTINAADGLTGGTYSLDLTADGFSGVSVVSTLRLIKRSIAGSWTLNGSHSAGTGTTETPVVHRTGMSGFSEFGVGSPSDNPLPVELSLLSAIIKESVVILNWNTETEVNNYGFEIQRSIQTGKWDLLGFVEGHGNSNSLKEYSFTDAEVNSSGIYYYRLKQIDNDGSYEFSKTIEVNFNVPGNFELSQNYPNPFNPSTTISFNLPKSGVVTLKVYNLMGEEIKTLVEGYREAGIYTVKFKAEGHPSGMYLYRLSTNGFTETKKMLIMK